MNGKLFFSIVLVCIFFVISPLMSVAYDRDSFISQIQGQAEEGNIEAQYDMGLAYAGGLKGIEDFVRAREWWLKAAEQEHDGAQYNLGLLYADGKGGSQDLVQARYWLFRASKQGHAPAQYHLASLYAKGLGGPKDLVEAYAWVNSAVIQGHSHGRELREKIKGEIDPALLSKAQNQSKAYKEKYTD